MNLLFGFSELNTKGRRELIFFEGFSDSCFEANFLLSRLKDHNHLCSLSRYVVRLSDQGAAMRKVRDLSADDLVLPGNSTWDGSPKALELAAVLSLHSTKMIDLTVTVNTDFEALNDCPGEDTRFLKDGRRPKKREGSLWFWQFLQRLLGILSYNQHHAGT